MDDVNRAKFDPTRKPHGVVLPGPSTTSGANRRPLILFGGGVAVVAVVIVIVLLAGGGGGSSGKKAKSSGTPKQAESLPASSPTLANRALQFSMIINGQPPVTYSAMLRSGTAPGQFVESEIYPSTRSQQTTDEIFSSSGIEVTAVSTASPTGGTTFRQFTTPLLLLKAPYTVGSSWSSTATSPTSQGTPNTVQVMDSITGISKVTIAGRTLQVVVIQLHHVITQGTITQDSTGTESFSPMLGTFVSGQSTEVITSPGRAPRTTTGQFQLEGIG